MAFGAGGAAPVWCEGSCPQGFFCNLIGTDTNGDNIDDTFRCRCQPILTEACCLFDGSCVDVSVTDCQAIGGISQGPGSACEGDANGNNIDDACEDDPCEDCGPGYHWVDNCPGGFDNMPTGAILGIDTGDDCVADTNLVLHGPVYIARSNPRDDSVHFPGTRPLDGHLDVLDTEIVSLSLTGSGVTLTAGAGLGQGGVLRASLGTIAELPSNAAWAESLFDVYVEMELGDGSVVYNRDPVPVTTVIDCLPPNRSYIHPIG